MSEYYLNAGARRKPIFRGPVELRSPGWKTATYSSFAEGVITDENMKATRENFDPATGTIRPEQKSFLEFPETKGRKLLQVIEFKAKELVAV